MTRARTRYRIYLGALMMTNPTTRTPARCYQKQFLEFFYFCFLILLITAATVAAAWSLAISKQFVIILACPSVVTPLTSLH